jgi:hypothetical protein
MTAKEFREAGYIMEINRRILHPHGLALSVIVTDEPTALLLFTDPERATLNRLFELGRAHGIDVDKLEQDVLSAHTEVEHMGPVVDHRDDPGGIYFGDLNEDDRHRSLTIERDLVERSGPRSEALGFVIEPLPA